VKLENGSQLAVRASGGEAVAIAVRFGIGAGSDAPAQHGRAALLATLMATACAGRSADALALELQALGASLQPSVSDAGLGVVLTAPAAHAQAAAALATECALAPSLDRDAVTRARLSLRARLDPRHATRARAALALLPRTPGALAPWGNPDTLPSVDERALSELLARARRGARVSVAVLGKLDTRAMVDRLARRLSFLEKEAARAEPAPPVLDASAAPPLPPRAIEALFVWRAQGCAPAGDELRARAELSDAARAFAAGAALELVRKLPVASAWSIPWLDGGCAAGVAWAALLARAPADELARGVAASTSLGAGLDLKQLAIVAARASEARHASSLVDRAQALAQHALEPRRTANLPTQRILLERLRSSAPFIVGSAR
jgi:hypothetical protein